MISPLVPADKCSRCECFAAARARVCRPPARSRATARAAAGSSAPQLLRRRLVLRGSQIDRLGGTEPVNNVVDTSPQRRSLALGRAHKDGPRLVLAAMRGAAKGGNAKGVADGRPLLLSEPR